MDDGSDSAYRGLVAAGEASAAGGDPRGGAPAADASGDDRRGRGRPQPEGAASGGRQGVCEDGNPDGTCLSITYHQTRQSEIDTDSLKQSILAVDWYESSGILQFDRHAGELFDELERCQRQSEQYHQPIPCSLGDGQILVYAGGMGRGRATHFPFRLEWLGATIGLAARTEATRKLANFYLKVPGEPCVIHGAENLRERVLSFLNGHGLTLVDEWFRRFDVCLDLPDCDWQTTFAWACEAKQYMGSALKSSPHRHGEETTGFSVKTGNVDLVIYDKRGEVLSKKPEVYLNAMMQNRWGGRIPQTATRIEYQFRRQWFSDLGLNTVLDIQAKLPEIIAKITQFDNHPFFVLTDRVPDRKGRHQNRAGVLPTWRQAVECMRERAGQPMAKLRRLDRSMMNATKALQNAVGYTLTAMAQLEMYAGNRDDVVNGFADLLRRSAIDDESIGQKWGEKARRAGTFGTVSEFPFGDNLAV